MMSRIQSFARWFLFFGWLLVGCAPDSTEPEPDASSNQNVLAPDAEPEPGCGDGIVDPGEECDGDVGGLSCQALGYSGGLLECSACRFVGCYMCENGFCEYYHGGNRSPPSSCGQRLNHLLGG
ncbi:hypothetical protein ACFL51_00940 [Myxococcota bacterium]